jgi:hypothetical protein
VQGGAAFGLLVTTSDSSFRELGGFALVEPPHDCGISRPVSHAHGDPEKPARKRVALSDRSRASQEYQKGCLERVLSVVRITEDSAAHMQNHRAVPLEQQSKGRLGMRGAGSQELLQKLAIG